MPQLKKNARAAKARELVKRLKREAAAALRFPPVDSVPKLEPQYNLEFPGEGKSSFPLEPTIEIDIKQEPVQIEGEQQVLQQDEVEIKEELLDPENSTLVDGEQDPIGQDGSRSLLQSKEEDENDNRCQFCLKLFEECGGRGIITKMKIEFVLGLHKWGTTKGRPNCCEGCRRMFDLFYDFKQSCLIALARPAELFVWAGNKGPAQLVDLRQSKNKPRRNARKKKKNPKAEDFCATAVSSTQENLDRETLTKGAVATEAEDTEYVISDEKFSDKSALTQHLTKHYPAVSNETGSKSSKREMREKKTYCGRCRKWFTDKSVYSQHQARCIEAHELNKRPPLEYACSMCPKKFLRQQELTYHINMHNGVRTIPCRREGCTKMFYHPSVRQNHEKLCGQEIQVICSICGSMFRSQSALRVHLATHGDPQFMCEICNKGFYSKANLKKHATAHSDERKFQCKVCGKRFKSHEANRVHQRIHTDEKPYVCHICGQRFTYNCLLKTHLEKGHDLVPEVAVPNTQGLAPNAFGGLGF